MDYKKAREVTNALFTIADFLDMEVEEFVNKIAFWENEEKKLKIIRAVKMHNELVDMKFSDRLRAFGYEVKEPKGSIEVSTTL